MGENRCIITHSPLVHTYNVERVYIYIVYIYEENINKYLTLEILGG